MILECIGNVTFKNHIDHNAGVSVICKECLKKKGVDKKFKKQNPELTKEIEGWLK